MRLILIIIISCFFQCLHAGGYDYYSAHLYLPPDTVPPPPPPDLAVPLTGPAFACIGDTSEYLVDVPVACTCQWEVDGIIQPDTTSPFIISWNQTGLQTVSVVFVCEDGQTSDPQTISVIIFEPPSQPAPISGDIFVCEYTFHTYSTTVGPYDSCEWRVNGIIQPGYSPSITYSFGSAGSYQFEVIAYNPCGTSSPRTLEVTAQGSAPAPPSPIGGPAESCEGNTDIYTTSVEAGESCEWRVDGIVQPSIANTLEVTWTIWGDHLIEVRAVSDCGTGNPALKTVSVMYQPDVFLGNDTTIMQGQSFVLDAGNLGSDYLWSTGDTTQTITVNATAAYSVDVSNFCGSDSDTIAVYIYVGIAENNNPGDCFTLALQKGKISFLNLPEDVSKIQVINLSGSICCDSPPVNEITVACSGIYLIRIISRETVCYKKIFIP